MKQENSEYLETIKGARQGYILGPLLFVTALDEDIKEAKRKKAVQKAENCKRKLKST